MSNISYGGLGSAITHEMGNQESISWIIGRTEGTEYDWMCKQFERESAIRNKIYYRTVMVVVITAIWTLPLVIFGLDATLGRYQ